MMQLSFRPQYDVVKPNFRFNEMKETTNRTLFALAMASMLGCLASCVPLNEDASTVELTSPVVVDGLPQRIDKVLQSELAGRKLSSAQNAAWQIMHGVICYGHDLPLETPDRGTLPALHYAFHGGNIRGFQLMPGQSLSGERRGVKAVLEPGSYIGQGHVDQWIAICAMANLAPPTRW